MRLGPAVLIAALTLPVDLASQSTALVRVDSLTASGRIQLARETLQKWWDESWDSAERTDAQWALWLRARLTVDPDMAALDYRRLIIEHPAARFTADAHLRLGQSALARGEAVLAARHFQSVIRDYPSSPARRQAQEWMDRVGPVAASQPAPPAPYAIQLGAFFNDEGASELYDRALAAGLKARRVRVGGDDLRRVRVGWFASREAAEISVEAVRRLGFEGDHRIGRRSRSRDQQ